MRRCVISDNAPIADSSGPIDFTAVVITSPIRALERRCAVRLQAVDDVAFGKDADHLAAVDHRRRADPPLGEQRHRLGHGRMGCSESDVTLPLPLRIAAIVMFASPLLRLVALG